MTLFAESVGRAASGRPADVVSQTVVLGYDGSPASRRALVRAAEAAGAEGSVIVVTAIGGDPASEIEAPASLLDEAAALLGDHGVDASTELGEGDPVDELVAAARASDARLIVVGARGDSFVARTLRGSVGERLVSRAPCDLLVAR